MNLTIKILIGLPGCHKSTYARVALLNAMLNGRKTSIVCHDNIREMLFGEYRFDASIESVVTKIANDSMKYILWGARNLIIDDTLVALNDSHRRQLIGGLRGHQWKTGTLKIDAVQFPTDIIGSKEARMGNHKGLGPQHWVDAIDQLAETYRPVQSLEAARAEGFDGLEFAP